MNTQTLPSNHEVETRVLSGATMLPSVWRIPTVLLWSKYFVPEFWRNVVPPDGPYVALDTAGLTVEHVVETVRTLLEATYGARATDDTAAVRGREA